MRSIITGCSIVELIQQGQQSTETAPINQQNIDLDCRERERKKTSAKLTSAIHHQVDQEIKISKKIPTVATGGLLSRQENCFLIASPTYASTPSCGGHQKKYKWNTLMSPLFSSMHLKKKRKVKKKKEVAQMISFTAYFNIFCN